MTNNRCKSAFKDFHVLSNELKTLEWDILNSDRLINLEINNRGEQALFNLEIKKKSGSSIDLDIHHSKVFSYDYFEY